MLTYKDVPMRMMMLNIVALVAVGAAASGCGGGDDPTPGPSPNTPTISIRSQNGAQSFTPNPADFGGQAVVFRNDDVIIHRVLLNDGSLDTGNIAPGATSAPVVMPSGGTNYHCSLHPDMVGAVNASGGGAPPPCTLYC